LNISVGGGAVKGIAGAQVAFLYDSSFGFNNMLVFLVALASYNFQGIVSSFDFIT
jgi:hypothetical protein